MIEIILEESDNQIRWFAFEDKKLLGTGGPFMTEENARKVAIKFLVNWYSVPEPEKIGL